MLDPNWYQLKDDVNEDAVVYTINNITFNISKDNMLNMSSFDTNQPEYNLNKNCTAALGHRFDMKYTWIAIPCSKTFKVTYFCQSKLFFPNFNFRLDLNPINSTCDKGWLMLANRPMCYVLLKPDKAISFDEGDRECLSRNASIYKVTVSQEPELDDTWLKTWFRMNYRRVSTKPIAKLYSESNLLRKLIFGTLLDNNHIENSLGQSAGKQQMLAGVKDRCGIIESLPNQMMIKIGSKQLRSRWFHKYRPCSTTYNITVLACEKKSSIYSDACSFLQFRCMDGTCLLLVYKCDGLADCFDASDELACSYNKTEHFLSPIHDLLHGLECLLYFSCNETQQSLLSIHDICDGVYTQQFPTEHELCKTNHLNHMYSSIMKGGREQKIMENTPMITIFDLFMKERLISLHKNISFKSQIWTKSNKTLKFTQYLTKCDLNGNNRSIAEMCKISAHKHPCHFDFASVICMIIWCPGMFKCLYSYCLPMSLVCDGYYDCPDGEDELFCSKLVCPGLLKCRGENKCVSDDELCDGQVNCRFTFDDEITCTKCPPGCVCFYYMISCEVNSTLKDITSSRSSYIKGLVVKGSLSIITIQEIVFYDILIFIDISSCGLENIRVLKTQHFNPPRILFADFNHNSLSQIKFILSEIFSYVVYADLSHNSISYITSRSMQLKYLQVLKIGGNPLKEIFIRLDDIVNLHILDISHVHYTDQINVYVDTLSQVFIEVRVTDATLCCILNSRCKLMGSESRYTCHQLIEKQVFKGIVYTLAIISFITCSAGFLIILLRFSSYSKNVKYYNIARINQSLSEICLTIYIIFVILADTLNINVVFWSKSVSCRIANIIFYSALSNCMIFKTFSVIMILLKIKFPFKHQCRCFRFICLFVILVWVCGALLYSVSIGLSYFFQNKYHILDKFCRFGECNKTLRISFIYFSITCIDAVFSFLFFLYGIQAYIILETNTINDKTSRRRGRFFVMVVIFKMGRVFVIELFFRFLLYILFLAKIVGLPMNENKCFLVFLVAMPTDIILSSAIGML